MSDDARDKDSQAPEGGPVAVINRLLASLTEIVVFCKIWSEEVDQFERWGTRHDFVFNKYGDYEGLADIPLPKRGERQRRFKVIDRRDYRASCEAVVPLEEQDLSELDDNQLVVFARESKHRLPLLHLADDEVDGKNDHAWLHQTTHLELRRLHEELPKAVARFTDAIESAYSQLQSLPDECLAALDKLSSTAWRASVRKELLINAASWPQGNDSAFHRGKVPSHLMHFLHLLEEHDPRPHWKRCIELADGYKLDLVAVCSELPNESPAPERQNEPVSEHDRSSKDARTETPPKIAGGVPSMKWTSEALHHEAGSAPELPEPVEEGVSVDLLPSSLEQLQQRITRAGERFPPLIAVLVNTSDLGNQPEPDWPSLHVEQGRHLLRIGGGPSSEAVQLTDLESYKAVRNKPFYDRAGKPIATPTGEPIPFRPGWFRQYRLYGRQTVERTLAWYKDPCDEWNDAATAGSRLVRSLPAWLKQVVWQAWGGGFWSGESEGPDLWLNAVFELAWQRHAGSLLSADRWAWRENARLRIEDLPKYRDKRTPHLNVFDDLVSHVGDPPAYWYSEIDNVWTASAQALVMLQTWLKQGIKPHQAPPPPAPQPADPPANAAPEPEAAAESPEPSTPTGDQSSTNRNVQRAEWLAKAMLLVRDNPGWSDAAIAREVGRSPSTLSRSREYKAAAAMARGSKNDRHQGHISIDPDTGQQGIEAYSDDPAERDWDA